MFDNNNDINIQGDQLVLFKTGCRHKEALGSAASLNFDR